MQTYLTTSKDVNVKLTKKFTSSFFK